MNELKTLKDLRNKANVAYGDSLDDCEYGCADVIKEEAIKWIKELENQMLKRKGDQTIEWIKHFFNITEEDLK